MATKRKVKIYLLPSYKRALKNVSRRIAEKLENKKKLLIKDPFHPSLDTHKLKGKLKNYYSFSVDYNHRVIFRFIDKNKVLFINIGTHDIYK